MLVLHPSPVYRLAVFVVCLMLTVVPTAAQDSLDASIIDDGTQPAIADPGAAGGQSLADFSQLMQLIQTTVEPESWEALGGVGTMAPYPAGIVVSPAGLLSEHQPATDKESKDVDWQQQANSLLLDATRSRPDSIRWNADDWKSPCKVRCVSVRRWMQALAAAPQPTTTDATNNTNIDALTMAGGLSKISLVLITEDDILLAGTVGGFEKVDGWWIDRKSGLPPVNLTALAVGLFAARNQQPFGCTIDPTTEGLQRAAAVGQQIVSGAIATGTAAESLAEALGRQDIRVFGTHANHEVAWLLIEADRHMKRLALGETDMPDGVKNYLEIVRSTAANSPPSDLLLRLWFTDQPLHVRHEKMNSDHVWQLAGTPLRLSGENELALLSGQRGNRVLDPSTEAFVNHFNQQWQTIRTKYPLYGALESVYQATAVAQLWSLHASDTATPSDHETLQRALLHFASKRSTQLATPTEVESIAVMHRYRQRNKMHQLVMASGGVSIQPADLLPTQMQPHASLREYRTLAESRPDDRWWWNADGN
ncbi:DUF1598 domain-containing protein [Rhodopirellula sp. JC740]|uniref:DUF1598 domain-containing protein n=1 Tax=Rhodopirellula halodulae TaxID=2894198 RepID=A0ABS8NIH1_9BACT|nr:DUF1598 domain-containing protein [Rhodopirellula sp. JC740]MCC9642281.1 DUF1598 domain-containing protein [Rhodopirellula sp. JC740]